jgi:AcrR family transcriptional regulator
MAEPARRVAAVAVLRAGAEQIRDEGIARLDLDETAARLAVTPEAVHYWFPDEGELLSTLMETRQLWFLDQSDGRLARIDSQAERLRELIELCASDHDMTYWIELWKLGLRDADARAKREELASRYREVFARVIRAGQQSGEFASISPDQVALVLVDLVAGLGVEVTLSDDTDPERMRAILTTACECLLDVELA